jgi:phosphoglycerol transferase
VFYQDEWINPFPGIGVFLTTHGYDEVNGLEELRPFLEDGDYLGPWGLFDDCLFELAEDQFDRVVQEAVDANQPFNFAVLTVDAHPPDGTPSASCTPYSEIDNNIFHAVHCTDQLIVNFVNHLNQILYG